MAHINYEIPEPLHRALKMEAASRGVTLRKLIILLLAREMIQLEPANAEPNAYALLVGEDTA